MRVLVADDDLTSRRILAAILRKWGFEPVVVEDGAAAAEALEGPGAPSLALLDWNMPGLEGPEVCRRLRAASPTNPPYLILLTARGEKADIVRGLESGANDYVSKPYDVEELRARVSVGRRMVELQADLVRARDELAFQASHDALTGLPNRRAILAALEASLARGEAVAAGLCDLDHFKAVNDTWGHAAGDEVLVSFARTAREVLGGGEALGRFGGEEFLAVVPAGRARPGGGVFDEVRRAVAAGPVRTAAGEVPLTVSVGVVEAVPGSSVTTLLAAADAALYRAKAEGRDRVVVG